MKNILQSILNPVNCFLNKYRYILMAVVIAALVLPEVSVYFNRPGRGADIHGYLRAGHDALQLNDLYRNSSPGKENTWPPFYSFFIGAPLAICQDAIGLPLTKIVWYFINFFALILTMQITSYFLYGKWPGFLKWKEFDFTSDKVFVPAFLVLPALVNNFFMLQINVFILCLVFIGLLLNSKGKYLTAGLFIALAASLKAYPGLFLFYFILRKQWKVSFSIMFFGVLFTLSPVVFYGIDGYTNLIREWMTITFSEPFVIGYTTFNNHSLYAFWERFLAHQMHLTVPASGMIKIFNLVSILTILGTVFTLLVRKPLCKDKPVLAVIEYSAICTMMILFPPIAWVHYWIIMLPAAASIYYCYRMIPKSVTPLITFFSVTSLLLIQIPYFFSKSPVKDILKSHSCYTISALFALIALMLLYYRVAAIKPDIGKGN